MQLFHQILIEAIASSPLNTTEVGSRCDVSQTSMSEFTTGKKVPKPETLLKLVSVFPHVTGLRLAQAWVRARLGGKLAGEILASEDQDSGDGFQAMLAALPDSTREALKTLVAAALDNSDLRQSLESLANFMRPVAAARSHLLLDDGADSHDIALVSEATPPYGKDKKKQKPKDD